MPKSRARRRPQSAKGRGRKVDYLNNQEPVFKSAEAPYKRRNRRNGWDNE